MQSKEAPTPPLRNQVQVRAEHLRRRLLQQRQELLEPAVRLPAVQRDAGREKLDQALLALDDMLRALDETLGEQQENP